MSFENDYLLLRLEAIQAEFRARAEASVDYDEHERCLTIAEAAAVTMAAVSPTSTLVGVFAKARAYARQVGPMEAAEFLPVGSPGEKLLAASITNDVVALAGSLHANGAQF